MTPAIYKVYLPVMLNIIDFSDSYEPDNFCTQASNIPTDGALQEHNFHLPGDEDWTVFQGQAGKPYLVKISVPPGSNADVEVEIYNGCGGGSQFLNPDFSPGVSAQYAPVQDGPQVLRLANSNEGNGAQTIYQVSVLALNEQVNPGAVIIVAGRKKLNDPVQPNIHNVTNAMYRLFLEHGYSAERIQYLATKELDADGDGFNDVDALSLPGNLQYAITQWAKDYVAADRALTVFIFDHGDPGKIYLNSASQYITPTNLDDWLSQIETAVPGLKVNLILEACFAGSFIRSAAASGNDALRFALRFALRSYPTAGAAIAALSKPGRVVISSTSAAALAYASTTAPQGAYFSDAFIAALDRGESLYTAFLEGKYAALASTYNVQSPWLDDNGDGIPNTSSDGAVAQVRGFTFAGAMSFEAYPPYIANASVTALSNGQGAIQADVRDDSGVLAVWAVIYSPSYSPPPTTTGEMAQEVLPTVMLLDTNQDGLYSALYQSFNEIGDYRIVIYAVDVDSQQARPFDFSVRVGGQTGARLPMRRGTHSAAVTLLGSGVRSAAP